jgi:hypothetical protein
VAVSVCVSGFFYFFIYFYYYFLCGGHALFGAGGRAVFCGGCALFGAGDRPVFGVGGGHATKRQTDMVARKGQLEGLEFVRSCRGGLVKKKLTSLLWLYLGH